MHISFQGLIRSKSLQRLNRSHTDDPMTSHYKDPVETLKSDFDKYLREYHTTVDIGETRFKNKNSAAQQVKPIPQAFSSIKENEQQDKPDNYIETPLAEFRKLYQSQKTAPRTAENLSRETKLREKRESSPKSPKMKPDDRPKSSPRSGSPQKTDLTNNKEVNSIKVALVKTKSEKKAELEILKQNISKMYNLQQPLNTEVPPMPPTEMAIENEHSKVIHEGTANENDQNLLRIEIETVKEVNKVQVPNLEPNLLVEVHSEVDATDAVPSESEPEGEKMSVNMTILISPKRSTPTDGSKVIDLDTPKSLERSRRSESPEQAAMLTRNDVLDAIFHADTMKEASSHDMRTEIDASKEHVDDYVSEAENHAHDDYVDDFSADVDNYNSHYSRSEFDLSPVSVQKTSEDENFWDI